MLNNVTLLGRLTADPVLRHTNTNRIPVASLSVAVNRPMPKDKDKEQGVDFFNIVAWQSTAEFIARNFAKGQPICIKGRLQQSTWLDKDTNTNRYSVEVVAESVYFAGYKKEDGQNDGVPNVNDADFDPYAEDMAA